MPNISKAYATSLIVQAILSIMLGLFLAIWPKTSTITVVYILAAIFAISGIVSLVSYARGRKNRTRGMGTLFVGLILLLVALLVFIFPQVITSVFTAILGVLLILSGVLNVIRSVELKAFSGSTWIIMLVISILIIAAGVVIIINPFASAVTFVFVLGICFIVKGIIDLIISYKVSKASKETTLYH